MASFHDHGHHGVVPSDPFASRCEQVQQHRRMNGFDQQRRTDEMHFVVQRRISLRAQNDRIQIRIREPPEVNQMKAVERGEAKRADQHVGFVHCKRLFCVFKRCRFDHAMTGALQRIAESAQIRRSRIYKKDRRSYRMREVHLPRNLPRE